MTSNATVCIGAGVLVYLAGMLGVGYLAARRIENAEDYLVGGRNLPIWLVTATIFAGWWGGETVLGASGIAYRDGIMGTVYDPWAIGGCLILAGLFYMKTIRKMRLVSLASFFRIRFGPKALLVVSLLFIPEYVVWTAAQILGIGKLFHAILGWDLIWTSILGAAVVIAYTLAGGILAVVWTDFVQSLLILLGICLILPLAISAAGGWSEVVARVPEEHWRLFPAFGDWKTWLWWFAAFTGIALGSIPAPDLMQRAMVARSPEVAARSSILAGTLYWTLGGIPLLLGLIAFPLVAKGILPAERIAQDAELIVPLMATHLLHPLMAAVFVGALLAGIMSSADTALFAPATIISNDLLKPYLERRRGRALGDREFLALSRYSVLGVGILATVVSAYSDTLYGLLVIAFTYVWHTIFFPFTLGLYWEKTTERGALAGMFAGAVTFLFGAVPQLTTTPQPEPLWTLVPALFSGLATVLVSRWTQKSDPPKPLTTEDGELLAKC
ncbi:MAG: sodium:solute symporter family protein [Elusimicrobiota bacterium]